MAEGFYVLIKKRVMLTLYQLTCFTGFEKLKAGRVKMMFIQLSSFPGIYYSDLFAVPVVGLEPLRVGGFKGGENEGVRVTRVRKLPQLSAPKN